MTKEKLLSLVSASFEQMVADRRHFHRHPELSFQEFRTTEYIEEKLRSFGVREILRPTATGVVARIRGAHPGETVAFRADIDALPIREENELPFCSENPGVMHACGHDGHAAMLLAVAKILQDHREELWGTAVCIFQHAEELPPGGAVQLRDAGVMEGVSVLYGFHLSSSFPTGCFGIRSGVLTSATDAFQIDVIGKGGHSSMPESAVDPVVMAAQVILGLQTIASRRIRAMEPLVLSVCQVSGGEAYNIIPEKVTLRGSLRTFGEETRRQVPELMRQITQGITASAGGSFVFRYEPGYASVVNDEALTAETEEILTDLFGSKSILHIDPLMPGEDFSALQGTCPCCFVEIGTANPGKDTCHPHHNPNYRMDEDGMLYGAAFFLGVSLKHLKALEG